MKKILKPKIFNKKMSIPIRHCMKNFTKSKNKTKLTLVTILFIVLGFNLAISVSDWGDDLSGVSLASSQINTSDNSMNSYHVIESAHEHQNDCSHQGCEDHPCHFGHCHYISDSTNLSHTKIINSLELNPVNWFKYAPLFDLFRPPLV